MLSEAEIIKSIGNPIIARDEYWGTYHGVLISAYYTSVGTMARVLIKSNIIPPLQTAIIFKTNKFRREPYEADTLHTFKTKDLEVYHGRD